MAQTCLCADSQTLHETEPFGSGYCSIPYVYAIPAPSPLTPPVVYRNGYLLLTSGAWSPPAGTESVTLSVVTAGSTLTTPINGLQTLPAGLTVSYSKTSGETTVGTLTVTAGTGSVAISYRAV